MYYSILCRFGPEWDGQRVIYTKSKALFEAFDQGNQIYFDNGFSEELKNDLKAAHSRLDWQLPYSPGPLDETMSLRDALEYLEEYVSTYPITVLGHAESNSFCNW